MTADRDATGRSIDDLQPLLTWLRTGAPARSRLDFATGTALPDGRLDMCKQDIGPNGAALIADALAPGAVRHVLLGTDKLGDDGAAAVSRRAGAARVETLYLGCNGITATGACRVADNLRASPALVTGVWLKRNPLGAGAGDAAAALVDAAHRLRTLDLVQTGMEANGLATLCAAILSAAPHDRHIDTLYIGGNPLGPESAVALAELITAGTVRMLYASAAGIGDQGAHVLSDALVRAPYGHLTRLSVASNGIGPTALARLVISAANAGVEVVDVGRVKAAKLLAAHDNRLDLTAVIAIATALAAAPHRLAHLILHHTGIGSREAHAILDRVAHAHSPTRYLFGKGVADSVRRRLNALAAGLPPLPTPPPDAASIVSVHR
ncbi:ribonuclease inhibitor [Stackebrandtia soli]|uniref:ribonuclease inhibitor n=1 Tax=Stackebrandtia soli TaxID=1892856 RepID=UPI0039EBCD50